MTIWKYPIGTQEWQAVDMQAGARILSVQVQDAEACLWALVDPDQPTTPRIVHVRKTGRPCDGLEAENFVGTIQGSGGLIVFHVFVDPEN